MILNIDLFSGIGGFSYAAELKGIKTLLFCEIDKYCQKVLAKNFPGMLIHPDIKTLTKEIIFKEVERRYGEHNGAIEFILTGGFPCQPFSHAGKRKGDKDERALFPEMLRVIRIAKPKWIVAENVGGILSINDGEYFEEVCSSLESEGYAVQSFIIPASAVNAPHRRDRVWIIAHTGYEPKRDNEKRYAEKENVQRDAYEFNVSTPSDRVWTAQNTEQFRCNRKDRESKTNKWRFGKFSARNDARISDEDVANTESRKTGSELNFCGGKPDISESYRGTDASNANATRLQGGKETGNFGISGENRNELFAGQTQWEQNWYEVATRFCRVDDGVSNRVDRLKGLGNAIVPQIAQIIFEAIKQYEEKK